MSITAGGPASLPRDSMANLSARDIVVLGGGPAGAATALELARRGRDVTLLEATPFDGLRLGETLPPEANPLLRRLGVWDAFLATQPLSSPGTVSAWGSPHPVETDFTANPHGSGWHVDRNSFDRMLCDAAASAGANICPGTGARRCTRNPDGTWTVTTSANDPAARAMDAAPRTDAVPVTARFIVDATGRNGLRLDPHDGRDVDDALIAIFLRFAHDGAPRSPDLRTLVESTQDGWWYVAPLPSGETVGVFTVEPDFYVTDGVLLGEQLERAPLTCARVGHARLVASHTAHVSSSLRRAPAGTGWAAAGDAAASYDPLSGFGIVKGLQDALALAEALKSNAWDDYAAAHRRRFAAYAAQRRAYYALERRWPNQTFWRNRVAHPVYSGSCSQMLDS
jgi:flavin-dependent dehydrogenase